jgi:hypothetical protein
MYLILMMKLYQMMVRTMYACKFSKATNLKDTCKKKKKKHPYELLIQQEHCHKILKIMNQKKRLNN